jgi:hypothetical protein
MLKIYPMAEFDADFPDDTEYDEAGEVVVFPGRNVATAIAELFERAGYKCTGPLDDEVHWGYHVTVLERPSMWFGVHTFEDGEYYLFAKDASPLDRFFPSAKRKYHAYLRELGRLLSEDPRFRNLRWFSRKDGGHNHPMPAPIEDD